MQNTEMDMGSMTIMSRDEMIVNEIIEMFKNDRSESSVIVYFVQKGLEIGKVQELISNAKTEIAKKTATIAGSQFEVKEFNPAALFGVVDNVIDISEDFDRALKNATITAIDHVAQGVPLENAVVPRNTGFTPGAPRIIKEKTYPNTLYIDGREIEVVMTMENPNIVVMDNVLTDEECDYLIAMGREKQTPSTVVDSDSGDWISHDARSSTGVMFQKGSDSITKRLEEFTAKLINWPYVNSEGMQLLNYQVGQQYLPHFDHFDPTTPVGAEAEQQVYGNRIGTLLFYLNNTEEGGGTEFTNLAVTVTPKRGRALFFSYPDTEQRKKVLHAGLPPTKGEKWVAVNWFRFGPYSS